ncbi:MULTISPECIES: uracil-DNA glycosylase family protein [unclassified Sphingomonas]|jgi:uracil-DNA glycosylase|uniref:uracil-DNA glycosylase family protein n=1 Tax=unclassified Sphingomonas TaxID=196159 RepID=UPI0008335499|nr:MULTISPECIES: uracil-DNA glycosylase family protein [unclassified Sphingomonas]
MSGELAARIAGCTHCARHLPHPPRPVVRFSPTARLLIIGQAPGARVHESGVPWDDASGARLCEWTGIEMATLHDPARVALVPMGFCYPGKGANADLPPRPECAPLWHDAVLAMLPRDRLTLLVGSHAQARYLPRAPGMTMTDRVRAFNRWGPHLFPLPHPAWRSTGWMRRNPWFAEQVLPVLRGAVRQFI